MIQQINPIHLSSVWHLVEQGIQEILETLNRDCLQELWIPEDVFTSIRINESVLWLCEEGFVVTQIRQDKYTGTKELFIWLAYSYDHNKDLVNDNYDRLVQYGKYMGCELIMFSSTRRGWIKRAKELGLSEGPTNFVARI